MDLSTISLLRKERREINFYNLFGEHHTITSLGGLAILQTEKSGKRKKMRMKSGKLVVTRDSFTKILFKN